MILCSIENTYKNNDQTTLKIDDANRASLRSFDTEHLRRETGKGKEKNGTSKVISFHRDFNCLFKYESFDIERTSSYQYICCLLYSCQK